MSWCEAHRIDYLFGLAKNERLVAEIAVALAAAEEGSKAAGQPARRFKEFQWSTRDSWSRQRRVIARAERTEGAANPRFVVTSLSSGGRRAPAALRGDLLRPRRHGKPYQGPHQGMSARSVRRPHLGGDDAPTSCACGSPQWRRCCSARCGAVLSSTPNSPRQPAARSASNCSRSARWCAPACGASNSR